MWIRGGGGLALVLEQPDEIIVFSMYNITGRYAIIMETVTIPEIWVFFSKKLHDFCPNIGDGRGSPASYACVCLGEWLPL